jgi:lysophospholipase L1-like esterase
LKITSAKSHGVNRFISGCVTAALALCLVAQSLAQPAPEQAVNRIPATDTRIAVMGRAQHLSDGSLRFGYPGVTLSLAMEGTSSALLVSSTGEQSYLDIQIDNTQPRVIKLATGQQTIPLFDSGAPHEQGAEQRVNITHRSETWQGIVTVHALLTDGQLSAAPVLPARRLLILGDSVTCGEAVERQANCQKNASWWNPRQSYGMLIADALNAQVNLVCYGGRGLVRSWNGKTDEQNLPDFFELTIADLKMPIAWDHSRYTPDLILSAIGTNDFSQGIPAREAYVTTYVTLLQRLLELHPQAQIVLTEGAILDGDKKAALQEYLVETAQRMNNPRIHVIPSNHYPGDSCDAHPTKAQHAAMAEELLPLLTPLMP